MIIFRTCERFISASFGTMNLHHPEDAWPLLPAELPARANKAQVHDGLEYTERAQVNCNLVDTVCPSEDLDADNVCFYPTQKTLQNHRWSKTDIMDGKSSMTIKTNFSKPSYNNWYEKTKTNATGNYIRYSTPTKNNVEPKNHEAAIITIHWT